MAELQRLSSDVVALVAVCDIRTPRQRYVELRHLGLTEGAASAAADDFGRAIHCTILEQAFLSDGRAILLRDGLGWSSSASSGATEAQWATLSESSMRREVLNVVLPDDAEDTGDDHPWALIVRALTAAGVTVTVDDLRAVPYLVVFAPRLLARLRA